MAESLPQWLDQPLVSRLLSIPLSESDTSAHIFVPSPHGRPNHVLINEYPPGVGIMPHKVCSVDGFVAWDMRDAHLMSYTGRRGILPSSLHREPRGEPVS